MTGLYIHIPFCKKRCSYCSFVIAGWNEEIENRYIERLIEEMQQYRGVKLETIYFGGGTPSMLSINGVKKIFNSLNEIFICDAIEVTFECNPENINDDYLSTLKDCGVNRISLGVQTFSNDILKIINRVHTSEDAIKAIEQTKKHFKNFSIDLILGLPEYSLDVLEKDLNIALKYDVPHFSLYGLSVEENTKLFYDKENKLVKLPNEDITADYYDYSYKKLEENNIFRYEVSNFSKKGYESKHNLKYWTMQEYIGIGIAAHSFFECKRFHNVNSLKKYLEEDNSEIRIVDYEVGVSDFAHEYLILGLRLDEGVNINDFESKTNIKFFEHYKDFYNKYENCFIYENGNLKIKHDYKYVMNYILSDL